MSIRSRSWVAVAASAIACHREPAPAGTDLPSPAPSASAGVPTASASAGSVGAATNTVPTRHEPWNVLLISIDCLRQDMPWAGYAKPIAPNLTKLAEESVVYTHAYSVSSYTAKSVAAFLASRYPSSLYRSGWFFTDYPKSNLFLAEVLHDAGIRTIAAHAHLYFGRGKQLDQGFDVWELVPGIRFDPETDKNVTSPQMTDIAIRELGKPENVGKQFFTWLHYTDPHDEYVKHAESPDFGKDNRGRYDSEVYFTDLHVGRLLEFVKKQPWWDHTVLIVTADHGEAFGEHGLYKHAFWLWEILVRVPLLVHVPGNAPQRIDVKRSQIDLAPTILDLMGIASAPSSFVGRSMAPEIQGKAPPDDRDPIVLDLPEDSHNPKIRAIVRGDTKLIVYGEGRKELYDLATDPDELHDLAKSQPEKLAAVKTEFDRAWATIPFVEPYGGMKLREGRTAKGPMGPAGDPSGSGQK